LTRAALSSTIRLLKGQLLKGPPCLAYPKDTPIFILIISIDKACCYCLSARKARAGSPGLQEGNTSLGWLEPCSPRAIKRAGLLQLLRYKSGAAGALRYPLRYSEV